MRREMVVIVLVGKVGVRVGVKVCSLPSGGYLTYTGASVHLQFACNRVIIALCLLLGFASYEQIIPIMGADTTRSNALSLL
jgi:hypothetical protein